MMEGSDAAIGYDTFTFSTFSGYPGVNLITYVSNASLFILIGVI